jgi:hypothetical protein
MDETILNKMSLKAGMTLCVLYPYAEFAEILRRQTLVKIVESEADFVLAFVRQRSELAGLVEAAKKARKAGGKLWLAYPKANATTKPDINRDSLFELTQTMGIIINGNFALDENWSLLRTKDLIY